MSSADVTSWLSRGTFHQGLVFGCKRSAVWGRTSCQMMMGDGWSFGRVVCGVRGVPSTSFGLIAKNDGVILVL